MALRRERCAFAFPSAHDLDVAASDPVFTFLPPSSLPPIIAILSEWADCSLTISYFHRSYSLRRDRGGLALALLFPPLTSCATMLTWLISPDLQLVAGTGAALLEQLYPSFLVPHN